MKNIVLGFLASHGGSNMQAIIDGCKSGYINAKPGVIISNNSKSGALERAARESIPAFHISGKTHPGCEADEIIRVMQQHDVNLIVLAGYMKKLDNKVIEAFSGRVLNIHPALLPKYGGKGMYGNYVHEAVLDSEDEVSGPTVHLVDTVYDHGRILLQEAVPVLPWDSVETLAARVLEQEHKIYPETIKMIADGEIDI